MSQVTYPNATHTRFAHSIGTLAVMSRILDGIKSEAASYLNEESIEDLRLAALLHDVGHYPYSHLMEGIDTVVLTEDIVGETAEKRSYQPAGNQNYPDHEEIGKEIISSQDELREAVGGKERAERIGNLITRSEAADQELSKLVHSSLDMDRLDYLKRDAQETGVPYGLVDINYLLNAIRISPTGMLGVAEKALHAAEQCLLARFFMHKTVFFHKTTYGIEEACRQLLRRMRDSDEFGMPKNRDEIFDLVRSEKLAEFVDDYVDRLVHRAVLEGDELMKALGRCIESRRPPKLLKEVQILHDRNGGQYHAGSFFWNKAKSSLKDTAAEFDIPIGQFLLCQTKPLRLEPRGPFVQPGDAQTQQPEKEDELVKVFIGADEEPRSLVDVPHSLIHALGSRYWQSFRLYVVQEAPVTEDVVDRLREKVRYWDSAPT